MKPWSCQLDNETVGCLAQIWRSIIRDVSFQPFLTIVAYAWRFSKCLDFSFFVGFELIVHGIVIIATLIIHPRVKVNLNVTFSRRAWTVVKRKMFHDGVYWQLAVVLCQPTLFTQLKSIRENTPVCSLLIDVTGTKCSLPCVTSIYGDNAFPKTKTPTPDVFVLYVSGRYALNRHQCYF